MTAINDRFFASIDFTQSNEFGLEFLKYSKQGDEWHYELFKTHPWSFAEWDIFSSALNAINYPLRITYSYKKPPTLQDARDLFEPWFQKIHFFPSALVMMNVGVNTLQFMFEHEDDKAANEYILRDFSLLLKELNYPFIVTSQVIDEEGETVITEEDFVLDDEADETPFIIESEEEVALFEENGVSPDEHLLGAMIFEKNEETLLANLEKMKKERANATKRGTFVNTDIEFITDIDSAYDFDGQVYSYDKRVTNRGQIIYKLGIGKNGHGIMCTYFARTAELKLVGVLDQVKVDDFVRIRGVLNIDNYDNTAKINIKYLDPLPTPDLPGDDYKGEKRIELHAHSKMSMMDGVSHVSDYIKLAAHMGHKAFAITDHGVVQAFPDAQKAGEKYGVKIIYGSELYLIDTKLDYITNPSPVLLTKASYCVFDFETTGLSARYDRIIEFGAVKVENGMITGRMDILINPGKDFVISPKITEITNITNAMVAHKPQIAEVIDDILAFIGDSILVSHNASFDLGFLNATLRRLGREEVFNPTVDTLQLSRYLFPAARAHNLGALARNMEVTYEELSAHRADYDAEVLNNIWQAMIVELTADNPLLKHQDLQNLVMPTRGLYHLRPKHVIALAKNEQGLKDLFKLVSLSHTEYFATVPKVPRDLLNKYRDNLIIGSACFNGEVFQTALNKDEDELEEVARFYDFIEIQPFANYEYLIHTDQLNDEEHLQTVVRDIRDIAKKLGKLIVATGDAHYTTPDQKIYRDVYIFAKGVGGINHPLFRYDWDKKGRFENPDQHYRSTTEMISEFKRFGVFSDEEILDYVVHNPHKINELINPIRATKKGLYKPTIENVDLKLRELVFKTAHATYGDPLPWIIEERVNKELSGIIDNGFAVIYYLAHQIVKKANDEGFIVGSRGSVGSSVVASFAHITEVNPLPPHYLCKNCQYSDFHHDEPAKSGYDLPPRVCPNCGEQLSGEGQNIPFETFLGFNAEKVPDIDLNFPEDYQKMAHDYTKVLFGENNVFRAGTISTVAEKTAFGYVRGYFERLGFLPDQVNRARIAYIAHGAVGVKRTTGQHPGGIIVIPSEYDVFDFTPIQYPADNTDNEWKTTHFDYGAIQDNVLKLDLLGHKDPVALKMLSKLTGISYLDVPLNEPDTLSIFSSPKALNLQHNYLREQTGALGIPEFGTNFVRQLLNSTQPKTFNDLVIISGLSHGTNVWRGNAESIIKDGITTLDGVIGCRDDIMTYLISQGLPGIDAFEIMEKVRRGKGLTQFQEDKMRNFGVPDYYIESCKKIAYLFPRAHATAYVIMAVKVAWFKVHYPLEYYATFFSIRGDNFDIKPMIAGKDEILDRLNELAKQRAVAQLNPRDSDIEENLKLALEMLDRGFVISNIDIYRSDVSAFLVDKENKALIPPFTVVSGLGSSAAETVLTARLDGEFLSIQDLVQRTKLNSQNIERLRELGALKGLPEENQISLFDFL